MRRVTRCTAPHVARLSWRVIGKRTKPSARQGASSASDGFGALAAGRAVDDQADAVAARRLALHQIDDVAEQPAERRPQDMQDFEARRDETGLCAPRLRRSADAARRPGQKAERTSRASPMALIPKVRSKN